MFLNRRKAHLLAENVGPSQNQLAHAQGALLLYDQDEMNGLYGSTLTSIKNTQEVRRVVSVEARLSVRDVRQIVV